jgi:hypothetical protein
MRPDPSSLSTRCHFFKIPLELRDNIYDYVAYGEKNPGLHVNLETATEPKLHAYDQGLSQTCSQIRKEYTSRLQRRIEHLEIDYQTWAGRTGAAPQYLLPRLAMSKFLTSQTVLIAERKESRGVWVQDDIALRSFMPLACFIDQNGQLRTLTFTVASSDIRVYNRQFDMMVNRHNYRNGGNRGENWDLVCALRSIALLDKVAQLDMRNWWMRLWSYHFTHDCAHYMSLLHGLACLLPSGGSG